MPMGAVLMNYMGHYVGALAATSRRPVLTMMLGWHPWAVIRVISFVVIGVVLSAPLLSRLGRFRVDWPAARSLLSYAAAGLIADIVLKTLLAPHVAAAPPARRRLVMSCPSRLGGSTSEAEPLRLNLCETRQTAACRLLLVCLVDLRHE